MGLWTIRSMGEVKVQNVELAFSQVAILLNHRWKFGPQTVKLSVVTQLAVASSTRASLPFANWDRDRAMYVWIILNSCRSTGRGFTKQGNMENCKDIWCPCPIMHYENDQSKILGRGPTEETEVFIIGIATQWIKEKLTTKVAKRVDSGKLLYDKNWRGKKN